LRVDLCISVPFQIIIAMIRRLQKADWRFRDL